MTTTKQGRDKFMERAVPCVFLGYPYGTKAYKVMSLGGTHKFYSSRDIVFHEEVFLFSTSVPSPLFPTDDRVHSHCHDNGAVVDGPVFYHLCQGYAPTTSQAT